MKEIKILKPHNENCCIKDTKNMWYVFEKFYYGNWAGNEKAHRNWYPWLMFRCNDPRCKFVVIVEDVAINRFLNKELSTQP